MKRIILIMLVVFAVPVAFFGSEKEVTVAVEDFTFTGAVEKNKTFLQDDNSEGEISYEAFCGYYENNLLGLAIGFTVASVVAVDLGFWLSFGVIAVFQRFLGLGAIVLIPFGVFFCILSIFFLPGIPLFWSMWATGHNYNKSRVSFDVSSSDDAVENKSCSVGLSIGLF